MAKCHRRLLWILLLGLLCPGCAGQLPAASDALPILPSDRGDRLAETPFYASDVVIAIDHSALALHASGIDVDRDGVVGRNREWVWSGDKTAQEALDSAVERGNRLLRRFEQANR